MLPPSIKEDFPHLWGKSPLGDSKLLFWQELSPLVGKEFSLNTVTNRYGRIVPTCGERVPTNGHGVTASEDFPNLWGKEYSPHVRG